MRVVAVFFGQPGGGSFNAAGVAGLARAAARFGLAPETVWEPVPARRSGTLAAAASRADLVIAHGGQGEAGVAEVAPRFPHVAFAVTLDGWWMRGDVAAHLSGERVPPGLRGRAGFAAGLTHARPEARLLTGFCGDQHDPALAARWTAAQAAAGAEVQFQMLDAGRPGAIQACRAAGLRAIGNVRDWTAEDEVFLASAVAENGVAVEAAITAFHGGRFEDRRIGLEAPEAVRLALARDVDAELAGRVEALRAAILDWRVMVAEAWHGEEWAPVHEVPTL